METKIDAVHTEFDTRNELTEKRKNICSFDELIRFLEDIASNYNCGYGNAPIAIAQACLAVAWFFSKEFGITGFQASFVMWDFIFGWQKRNNKTSLKLVDYDEMLYPQYAYKFEKMISKDTWKQIQKAAKDLLEEAHKNTKTQNVHPLVYQHWKEIASGKVPFGYELSAENV